MDLLDIDVDMDNSDVIVLEDSGEQSRICTEAPIAGFPSIAMEVDQDQSGDIINPNLESVVGKNADSTNIKTHETTTEILNQTKQLPDLQQKQADQVAMDYPQIAEQPAGGCEELCIIPDTERIIMQTEKDEIMQQSAKPVDSPNNTDSSSENFVVLNCTEDTINTCEQCCILTKSEYKLIHRSKTLYVCGGNCLSAYKASMGEKTSGLEERNQEQQLPFASSTTQRHIFSRKCMDCKTPISNENKFVLSWETLEFCNDVCLGKYQKSVGSVCSKCQLQVQENCMGKYCVRFGYNIRQFCSSTCLEQYKKGLKVCSYCQKEMSEEGFLAPVTDQSIFKDFCSKECLDKYKALSRSADVPPITGACSVCNNDKSTIAFEHENKQNQFCGEACFVAFKFVNSVSVGKCDMCHSYFNSAVLAEFTIYYDDALRSFCSKGCQNVYIIANRKIVPCCWCKVKKYNFDMIKCATEPNESILACSLNCLNLHLLSYKKDTSSWTDCDQCLHFKQPLYYLRMSDSTLRKFCSYSCVLGFQNKYPKTQLQHTDPVPHGAPKRFNPHVAAEHQSNVAAVPIITSVQSLAAVTGPSQYNDERHTHENGLLLQTESAPQVIIKTQVKQQIIIKPPPPVLQRNVTTMCKVTMFSKGTSCRTIVTVDKAVQTDKVKDKVVLIPIPVPVYVPLPLRMYSQPFPVPFPFPVPIPVPIFVPTTRNSAKGIMKEIKRIQAKMPSNPLEAELLMIADMVAGDKKDVPTDSETEEIAEEDTFTPEPIDTTSNSFDGGEEALPMAVNITANIDEPAVDLEGALTVNTVTAPVKAEDSEPQTVVPEPAPVERRSIRGRGGRGSRGRRQTRRSTSSQLYVPVVEADEAAETEKPDANMCLKYTFGVNAWKQWVSTKNAELEQTSNRAKLFKPEILQLTADELNYSLCLFVKEVRKPNGQEYAPDTIYYLCLGIQQYLYENNRIDNIFCDTYYEKFTDCLDEVAKKFSVLYNDSHYIITRVEEEHLWESKQLGAHSPHVLLSTLMFFNTKHFNLTSVEDHRELSFSHIMKHWKRNPTHSGGQKSSGSRNVLLRFYPPQTITEGNTTHKKKVYEQQENEDNPLRCPVKLYEFYLSKCPESVKTRNDVFYLLPERSCVPDSPVWYSACALPQDVLEKMLHRVKMVKEINVALLTS